MKSPAKTPTNAKATPVSPWVLHDHAYKLTEALPAGPQKDEALRLLDENRLKIMSLENKVRSDLVSQRRRKR